MLVRFSSIETGSITMFGDAALELIRMLGASGQVPGAIRAEDIPSALMRLRQELATRADTAPSVERNVGDDSDRDAPVTLATRAVPLIDLMQRASAANAVVMWDAV